MSIKERMKAPTPPFFQKLSNFSVTLAAISGVILSTPVELPDIFAEIAGYLAVAGAVSQAVTTSEDSK
ncbi:hypothetical protein [Paraflavitalea sp. CAU 1676]|uniref:hypothetical protein n=1 Tax=Paraflavitalea sp. CAU 1676 TaxID=3032598 RepID=UPI0023DB201D|nr:hypothetical protein [Paraflavitalea sp. CAU 1676]MDF2188329.1 hypothetical protein [Paraflavitalea sp. CAU 1676]